MRDFEASVVGDLIVDQQDVDVDRPGRQRAACLPADRGLHAAYETFERRRLQRGGQFGGDVEEGRPGHTVGRRGLVVRRDRFDVRLRTQALERRQNRTLAFAQIRADADVDGVHAND